MFLRDALAGITVALVALPLSIAIAIASGAEPEAGLITAIVAGLLISLLGGSRVQIGGPTGAFIVVVYGVIEQYGFDGLLLATIMAGIILVIGALVRAGRFIALVPEPVIEGFTIGIALIIAVSQLKDLLGLTDAKVPADLVEALPALWAFREAVNPVAFAVGLFSIVGIVLLRRIAPSLPGSLLVIAAARIDEDRVLRCAHDERVEAHEELVVGTDQLAESGLAIGELRLRAGREELLRDEGRKFQLHYTIDIELSDLGQAHTPFPPVSRSRRIMTRQAPPEQASWAT